MVDQNSGIYQETNGTGALAPHRTGTIPPAPSRMNAATVQNKCRHRTALLDHKHKVYLSPVVDCCDGMPVAWTIGTSPNAELANRMLRDACSTLGDGEHPIIHSDRGCHYRWPGWIRICGEHKLTRSMSAKGCSPDNAAAEGFFGRLRQESSPRARLRRRHHQGVHRTTGRIHDLVPGREDQTHFRHQHRQTKTRARTHGIIKEQGHRSPTKRHHPQRHART